VYLKHVIFLSVDTMLVGVVFDDYISESHKLWLNVWFTRMWHHSTCCSHTHTQASVTKRYNLVLDKRQWHSTLCSCDSSCAPATLLIVIN